MSHELLHVFKHADGQRLVNGGKVVEKLPERSAMFQIVEQRPNRHTCAHEDGRPAENLGVRMHAGDLVVHGSTSSIRLFRVYVRHHPNRRFAEVYNKKARSLSRAGLRSNTAGRAEALRYTLVPA
jgi:hypothetical protein